MDPDFLKSLILVCAGGVIGMIGPIATFILLEWYKNTREIVFYCHDWGLRRSQPIAVRGTVEFYNPTDSIRYIRGFRLFVKTGLIGKPQRIDRSLEIYIHDNDRVHGIGENFAVQIPPKGLVLVLFSSPVDDETLKFILPNTELYISAAQPGKNRIGHDKLVKFKLSKKKRIRD